MFFFLEAFKCLECRAAEVEFVCLWKKVLPEAVFLGKEREKSLTVHLVSITTAVHFSSPVALCVSFWMSKKDTKTIVHF